MGSFITLTDRSDFLRVQHRGSKAVSKAFVLQGIGRADGHASLSDWRIGFTASKKVGNAVHRNRAKRRLRAVVGQTMPSLARSNVDYVLIARMPLTDKAFRLEPAALEYAVQELHKKLDRRSNESLTKNKSPKVSRSNNPQKVPK